MCWNCGAEWHGRGAFCPFCIIPFEIDHQEVEEFFRPDSADREEHCPLCTRKSMEDSHFCRTCEEFVTEYIESFTERSIRRLQPGYCDTCGREAITGSAFCKKCLPPVIDSSTSLPDPDGFGEPHLCLTCGDELPIDPEDAIPLNWCPLCDSTEIVSTSDWIGSRCPYCENGTIDIHPLTKAINEYNQNMGKGSNESGTG